ncbi:MAG TPA: YebC/PmpR family DNA-binding transcriptional regulator [Syntrophomonadaceae bacterium]|nr:YebC/PmpR family DNA-binding transcriptional regulator [Syntrophomonadaceae bacterium]
MSGHSKWANIKHQKARTDERKGKEFTKIAKEIIIAARQGGGDPDGNSKLKMVIQKAKAINMPNDNIARAIKKGTGELDGDAFEEIFYEGYGPNGVAIMLDIATDNRNRTASEIRHLFSKHNGNLGEAGCVAWMFKRCGLITVNTEDMTTDPDEFMLKMIEFGAEDVREDEDVLEVISTPDDFLNVKEAMEQDGIKIEDADIIMLPQNTVDITDEEQARKIMKLIDVLEDHDDVQNVYMNGNIPDEIMEKL